VIVYRHTPHAQSMTGGNTVRLTLHLSLIVLLLSLASGGFTEANAGGMSAKDYYRNRRAQNRANAAKRFGITAGERAAVTRGLKWLASKQAADGSWPAHKAGSDRCGVTGLAVLALLASGSDEAAGSYRGNVVKALAWISGRQTAGGRIGKKGDFPYGEGDYWSHAVSGLALAEAAGMQKGSKFKVAASRAFDYSLRTYQLKYSGWSTKPGGKSNTTASAWFVMQAAAAKATGVKVPGMAFHGTMMHLMQVKGKDGMCSDARRGKATKLASAAAAFAKVQMGAIGKSAAGDKTMRYLVGNLPQVSGDGGEFDWSYVLFGSSACFHADPSLWKKWHPAMAKALLGMQVGKGRGAGSWPALGKEGKYGGSVCTTAMAVLCLQAYCRYVPKHSRANGYPAASRRRGPGVDARGDSTLR